MVYARRRSQQSVQTIHCVLINHDGMLPPQPFTASDRDGKPVRKPAIAVEHLSGPPRVVVGAPSSVVEWLCWVVDDWPPAVAEHGLVLIGQLSAT
jgi:hypothetical protein